MVEIPESPSILFRSMAGSRMPIATAHGEGRASFAEGAQDRALVAMRYVDFGMDVYGYWRNLPGLWSIRPQDLSVEPAPPYPVPDAKPDA